jgi:hypothetical protein
LYLNPATCGARSKANHLPYIGDADVGKDANIGAGTITCNYDGVDKYRTLIGDRVQIGSDTQLVAPVSVGDDAYIAAGSTITRDVEAGALAFNDKPQRGRAGWVAVFRARKAALEAARAVSGKKAKAGASGKGTAATKVASKAGSGTKAKAAAKIASVQKARTAAKVDTKSGAGAKTTAGAKTVKKSSSAKPKAGKKAAGAGGSKPKAGKKSSSATRAKPKTGTKGKAAASRRSAPRKPAPRKR